MVAMSDELGADPVAVALLQYVRLLLVVFLAPVAVQTLFPAGPAAGNAAAAAAVVPTAPWALNAAALVLCALLGSYLGRRLHFPSPNFLGPVVAAVVLGWSLPYQFALPAPVFNLGMLLVGLSIGVRCDLSAVPKLGKAVVIEVVLVLALILLCLAVGYGFHLVTGISPMTAVLGSTPGGMDMMVATAAELGADPGMVLAMQMTRWLMVLLAGPWVAARLVRRPAEHVSR
jgi:membrane AbrB-like protein